MLIRRTLTKFSFTKLLFTKVFSIRKTTYCATFIMDTTLKKVLITDPIDKSCIEILEKNNIPVDYRPKLPAPEILEHIKDADALIIRSGTNVNAEVIGAAKQLKIIGRAGVGVDNVDCNAATRQGVVVINAPSGNTLSAAEHTCAMIMSLARQIPQACETLKAGRWDRNKFMGNELHGKTLGIVGLGRIGREVAHRMQSFGMTTIGFDPLVPADESVKFGVEWLTLDEIWPRADYVTLHVPLIPQTKNMINKEVLNKCKKGIRFVNVARGGIIDDAAIYEALESGQCGGLGVDVFIEEPPKEFTLIKHPKVVCTPHLGANTTEGQIKVAQEISNQFLDFVHGRPLSGAVNAGAFNDSMNAEGKPWAKIARALGQLAVNITAAGSKDEFSVTVVLGESLAKMKNLLLASTLTGILEKTVGGGAINLINASLLATAAGIKAKTELRSIDLGLALPAIGVDIVKDDEHHFVVGSAAGPLPLLVSIDSATFGDGIPLKGVAVFFKSNPNAKSLGSIIENLSSQSTTVNYASESSATSGDKWYVIGLSKKLPSTKDVGSEISTFVTQVEFN